MRHFFRANRAEEKGKWDLIWFDSEEYSLEAAAAKFNILADGNNYEVEGYVYDSTKYSKIIYLGEHDSCWKMMTEKELLDAIFETSGKYEYDNIAGTIKVQK